VLDYGVIDAVMAGELELPREAPVPDAASA